MPDLSTNPNPDANPQDPPADKPDATVPSSRLREETAKRKEAEQKLQRLEAERQQAEEKQAQEKGQYEELAKKRAKTIEQRDARIRELETQITRDRRYRSFVGASAGLVLPEALDDAFSMLTDEEWQTVNDEDESAVRMLVQGLAERKPYLASGPRGAGSYGSTRPVFGQQNGSRAKQNPFKGGPVKKAAYK